MVSFLLFMTAVHVSYYISRYIVAVRKITTIYIKVLRFGYADAGWEVLADFKSFTHVVAKHHVIIIHYRSGYLR